MLGIATAPESRTGNRGDELQKSPCRPRPDADDQAPPSDRAYHGYRDGRLLSGQCGASFPHQVCTLEFGPRVPGSSAQSRLGSAGVRDPVAGVAIGYRQAPLYDDSLAFLPQTYRFAGPSHAKKFLQPSTAASPPRFFLLMVNWGLLEARPDARCRKVKPFSTRPSELSKVFSKCVCGVCM